jgi:hypothetical protein
MKKLNPRNLATGARTTALAHPACRISTVLFAFWIFSCQARTHTLEFDTTQVTTADVAVAHDGQTLVFTMLGHLFKMPSAGGTAEQLTFGAYFDADPAFSLTAHKLPSNRIAMAARVIFSC